MDQRPVSTRQDTAEYRLVQPYTTLVSTVFGRRAGWLVPLCAAAVALVVLSAQAQPPPELPRDLPDPQELALSPLPLGTPKAVSAPDWMLWRAFHRRLEFYQRESPNKMHTMLAEHGGLAGSEAYVVDTAGSVYLDELALIEDQAREEISSRFTLDERLHGPFLASMRSRFELARPDMIPARTPDGRLVKEVLAAEGFFARLEERRKSVFRAHWESLAASIGLFKLVGLERFIEKDVTPSVRVATRAKRVPAQRPVPKDQIAPR